MANPTTRNATDASPQPELLVIEPLHGTDTVVVRYDDIVAVERELQQSGRDSMPAHLGTRLHLAGGHNLLLPLVSFETVAEALENHYGQLAVTEMFFFTGDASPSYIRIAAISGWSTMRGCGGVYLQ